MATKGKIRGIYIAVELDKTKINSQITSLVKEINTEFKKVDNLGIKLETGTIASQFKDAANYAANLKEQIAAIGKTGGIASVIQNSKELSNTFKELSESTGLSTDRLRAMFTTMTRTSTEKAIVSSMTSLARAMGLTGKEAFDLAKSFGVTGAALEALDAKFNRTSKSGKSFAESLKNLITTNNAMAALQSGLAVVGMNISFGGIVELGKAAVKTSVEIDSLNTAFTSIDKSSALAAGQLEVIRKITNDLGLEFYSTAKSAKGFYAAAKNSTIAKDADKIFYAFSAASSALKLTNDDVQGVMLAISQMMSKGKISAEELRQQLAERLPGAVQVLAKSMGVTGAELDKMLEGGKVGLENLSKMADELIKIYDNAGKKAGRSMLGEMNRLSTAWTDFKASIFSSQFIADAIRKMRVSVEGLTSALGSLSKAWNAVYVATQTFFASYAALKVLSVIGNVEKLTVATLSLAKAWNALKLAMVSHPIGAIAVAISSVIGVLSLFTNKNREATKSVEDFKKPNAEFAKSFKSISEETDKATKSLDAYAEAKRKAVMDTFKADMQSSIANLRNGVKALSDEVGNIFPDNSYGMGFGGILNSISNEKSRGDVQSYVRMMGSMVDALAKGKISSDSFLEGIDGIIAGLDTLGVNTENLKKISVNMFDEVKNGYKASEEAARGLSNEIQRAINLTGQFQLANSDIKTKTIRLNAELTGNKAYSSVMGTVTGEIKGIYDSKNQAASLTEDQYKSIVNASFKSKEAVISAMKDIQAEFGAIDTASKESLDTVADFFYKSAQAAIKATASKGSGGSGSVENKRKSAENLLKAYESEMKTIQIASQYAPDSFSYAWEMLNTQMNDAEKKVASFKKTYAKVLSGEELEKAGETIRANYNQKLLSDQDKLLNDWLSKSNSAMDEYYMSHGLLNERVLKDAQKNYDSQANALKEMLGKEVISYEDYLKRIAALDEQRNKITDKEKAVSEGRFFGDANKGFNSWFKQAKEDVFDLEKIGYQVSESMYSNFSNAFTGLIMGTKDMKSAFKDAAMSMLNDIVALISKMLVLRSIEAGMGGGFSSFFKFANGGIADTGMASGVYTAPTYFNIGNNQSSSIKKFAKGNAVFAEAGPEAIMPLARTSSGKLGVAAVGGTQNGGVEANIQVNVYNNSNSKAEVRQSTNSSGGKTIDVYIGDMVAKQMVTPGTKLNRAVSAQTGSTQSVVRR